MNLPPVPIGSKFKGSKSDRPIPTAGCGGLIGPPRNGSNGAGVGDGVLRNLNHVNQSFKVCF
jgi:hypothetical protein